MFTSETIVIENGFSLNIVSNDCCFSQCGEILHFVFSSVKNLPHETSHDGYFFVDNKHCVQKSAFVELLLIVHVAIF